jgi:hypothetical protein
VDWHVHAGGTPPAIAARLNAEIKALRDDKVRTSFIERAQDPVGGTPRQFAKLVAGIQQIRAAGQRLNIKPTEPLALFSGQGVSDNLWSRRQAGWSVAGGGGSAPPPAHHDALLE